MLRTRGPRPGTSKASMAAAACKFDSVLRPRACPSSQDLRSAPDSARLADRGRFAVLAAGRCALFARTRPAFPAVARLASLAVLRLIIDLVQSSASNEKKLLWPQVAVILQVVAVILW